MEDPFAWTEVGALFGQELGEQRGPHLTGSADPLDGDVVLDSAA